MPLSDTVIKAAKPKDKPYKLYDEQGLFIIIAANGGKWWRLKYFFNNKEKNMSLGTYPAISLKQARKIKDDARQLIAQGIDPSENKKAIKATKLGAAANSFEVIALEWIASHMANKASSHADKVKRRFETYIFPWLGNKAISDITAPEVLLCVKRVQNANKLETAARTLQATGQVFRYAVQTGRAIRDITADLKGALPAAQVKHMAAFTDPQEVAQLLRALDGFKGSLVVQTALQLAPLVFVRPSELRTAKWADIDLDTGEWRYTVSKTNTAHLVPLSTQAIALLKDIQPLTGHGEYVFTGGHDPKKPMSEAAINAALKRLGFDTQKDITGHGFRAMARTLLHERLDFAPEIIEHQLAHKVADALGSAYNRTKFIGQRKTMMQRYADYLDTLKAGAVVIQFKQG